MPNTWGRLYVRGPPASTPGQQPTYHFPQRIGDTGDVGVIDIALAHAVTNPGNKDTVMDACLLFRGRTPKCFIFPDEVQTRYDSGTAIGVVYPAPGHTFDNALSFAPLRPINRGATVTCTDWGQIEGSLYDCTVSGLSLIHI